MIISISLWTPSLIPGTRGELPFTILLSEQESNRCYYAMEAYSDQDYFIVSGIRTDTIVESIHVISRSEITDRAKAWHASIKEDDEVRNNICPEDVSINPDLAQLSESVETPASKAETRKELRAKRKKEIEDHKAQKPIKESPGSKDGAADFTGQTMTATLSLTKDLVERLVVVENEMLTLQSNFNQQLLDAARTKISIRDTVDLNNRRIKEVHKLFRDEGEAPTIDGQVSFCPGEYSSCQPGQTNNLLFDNDLLYLKGTNYDDDFLLYADVDLSTAAEAAKAEARTSLRNEIEVITKSTHAAINKFDESLRNLMQIRLELASKLKLRGMFFDIQTKQIEVLLDCDLADDGEVTSNDMTRDEALKTLDVIIPMDFSDIELSDSSNEAQLLTVVSKKMFEELNREATKLESTLKETNSQALDLRRLHKRLNSNIRKLKAELSQQQNKCEEIQVQKFGKPINASVLDISPVAKKGHDAEVNQIQSEMESFHRQDVDNAKQELAKLKAQLFSVTNENTELLREICSLREKHLKIDENIKRTISSSNTRKNKPSKKDEKSEYEKFVALSRAQREEIEMLSLEIQSLRTKCGHVAVNPGLGSL